MVKGHARRVGTHFRFGTGRALVEAPEEAHQSVAPSTLTTYTTVATCSAIVPYIDYAST
jgi:hypothetical protein